MELQFERSACPFLDTAVREVRNLELTQEIRLPEGMPDIGRVLCAWGQTVLRGKEWRSDSVSFSGGLMVWVLYAPEDGSEERCLDTWIPFQMRWELPEDTPEGEIRILCLPRFTDARSISPRKIMIRSGMSVLAEAMVPKTSQIQVPGNLPEDIQLLRSTYPLRMYQEVGEKPFVMDEQLPLPESAPRPQKLLYYRMDPVILDRKVLADKIVFRGTGRLHVLYRSEEGQIHSWSFEPSFSQFAELRQEHGPDAQLDIRLASTNLELEPEEQGCFRLKAGLTAQYAVSDKCLLELTEDAYSPARELEVDVEQLTLPVLLETRRETMYPELSVPAHADIAVDAAFLPDFPFQKRRDNAVDMGISGAFQVLYYAEDGSLQSSGNRWEKQQNIPMDENSRIQAIPLASEAQASAGNGQLQAKAELPMELIAASRQSFPVVTQIGPGELRKPDSSGPSLILRRAGDASLWEIAKSSRSTIEAIRRANQLSGEPESGQMLLIPVKG